MKSNAWQADHSPLKPCLSSLLAYVRGTAGKRLTRDTLHAIPGDPLLDEALAELRQALREDPAHEARAYRHRYAFRQGLREAATEPSVAPPPHWPQRLLWSLVATCALLLLLIPGWWSQERGVAPQRQLTTLLTPPPPEVSRGAQSAQALALARALQQYHEGTYESARRAFAAVAQDSSVGPRIQLKATYYLGVSELMLGNLHAAQAALQQVLTRAANPWQEDAQFYLGWVYFRQGRWARAQGQFAKISRRPGPYRHQARQILSLLR